MRGEDAAREGEEDMSSRQWYPGMCKFRVGDSVSRTVGKRPCGRKPVKNDLCTFHQPEKVKERYDKLLKKHGVGK